MVLGMMWGAALEFLVRRGTVRTVTCIPLRDEMLRAFKETASLRSRARHAYSTGWHAALASIAA